MLQRPYHRGPSGRPSRLVPQSDMCGQREQHPDSETDRDSGRYHDRGRSQSNGHRPAAHGQATEPGRQKYCSRNILTDQTDDDRADCGGTIEWKKADTHPRRAPAAVLLKDEAHRDHGGREDGVGGNRGRKGQRDQRLSCGFRLSDVVESHGRDQCGDPTTDDHPRRRAGDCARTDGPEAPPPRVCDHGRKHE